MDAYPEEAFSGVVTQVRNAATTTSNVVTYSVILAVNNADLKLRPGMQMAAYAGFPASLNALAALREVFAEAAANGK